MNTNADLYLRAVAGVDPKSIARQVGELGLSQVELHPNRILVRSAFDIAEALDCCYLAIERSILVPLFGLDWLANLHISDHTCTPKKHFLG